MYVHMYTRNGNLSIFRVEFNLIIPTHYYPIIEGRPDLIDSGHDGVYVGVRNESDGDGADLGQRTGQAMAVQTRSRLRNYQLQVESRMLFI